MNAAAFATYDGNLPFALINLTVTKVAFNCQVVKLQTQSVNTDILPARLTKCFDSSFGVLIAESKAAFPVLFCEACAQRVAIPRGSWSFVPFSKIRFIPE